MTVLEHFEALCAIPHCSGNAGAMLEYLEKKAAEYGYATEIDAAGNLLCSRADSKVTLQAHYDMVCIGSAPGIETVTEEGWLKAKDSTLGADNGMGIAMMLALMETGAAMDALFTADEEIGLIGARVLGLKLKTPYLLNLDSEEEGEITIGCAGGVDLNVSLPITRSKKRMLCYEVVAEGYPGGHSGVDIDKAIPNAIKELAAALYGEGTSIVSLVGGERRNAIAKKAVAVAASSEPVELDGWKPLGHRSCEVIDTDLVRILHGFAHGVRAFNAELGIVQTSINLAQVETREDTVEITLSARSMNETQLRRIESETAAYFEAFGAKVRSEGFYPPWEPEENAFVAQVKSVYEAVFDSRIRIVAIHAGLECGILKEHAPTVQMASIGPTIRFPHSTRETVDLQSVERVFEVVKTLLTAL